MASGEQGRIAAMAGTRHRISVLIPCYNYERYIAEAIDSVLAQTRPADEILVVDDGSTDGSARIIASFGARVRLIAKPNGGTSDCRNHAFLHATGAIVLFLDADDRLAPNALAEIERHWFAGVAKVQYDLGIIDGAGRDSGDRYGGYDARMTADLAARQFRQYGTYPWPVTAGNAYDRCFVSQILPYCGPGSHDGILNSVAPMFGAVVTIPQVLGYYRLHNTNLSRTDDLQLGANFPDFPRFIRDRQAEFDFLAVTAAARGVRLPPEPLINNEIAMLDYKIMCQRLGLPYASPSRETRAGLFVQSLRVALFGIRSGNVSRFTYLAWLTLIAILPVGLCRKLLVRRFTRRAGAAGPLPAIRTAQPTATGERA